MTKWMEPQMCQEAGCKHLFWFDPAKDDTPGLRTEKESEDDTPWCDLYECELGEVAQGETNCVHTWKKQDEERGLTVPASQLATVVQQMMAPVMEQIGAILERTNQAMERIAATQQMMSTRISDLEKQVRLKTPLSKAQEKYVNDAIRARARELLAAKGVSDRKALTKLGNAIRKSVLQRYGYSSLRDYPAYDYETALKQVSMWNDLLMVRETVKEAKERAATSENAGQPADADGSETVSGEAH